MVKRKVVQDSEDEDERETGTQTNVSDVDLDNQKSPPSGPPDSASASTGSTDSLVREIQAAHANLMAPTPNAPQVTVKSLSSSQQHQSFASPSTSNLKSRRATTETGTAKTKATKKKPPKRYGSQQDRDLFEFRGSSDGEVELSSPTWASQKLSENEAKHRKAGKKLTDGQENHPLVDSAISKDHICGSKECFEPSNSSREEASVDTSMPPPTAKAVSDCQTQHSISTISTIPDSTPARPISGAGEPAPIGETVSNPLTSSHDRMPMPTMSPPGTTYRTIISGSVTSAPSHNEQSRVANDVAASDIDELQEPSSSASVISPSKVITVQKTVSVSEPKEELDTTSAHMILTPQTSFHTSGTAIPIVLLPEQPAEADQHDELSLPLHPTDVSQSFQLAKGRKRKAADGAPDQQLGSDDAAIGLPRDNYQPRPSRSRSGLTGEDILVPTDYSKRPEAVVKNKRKYNKRRKTTAFHELVPKVETDDDDDDESKIQVPKVNIAKLQELKPYKDPDALEAKDGETIEHAQEQSHMEDAVTDKPAKTKKQRGRPKKAASDSNNVQNAQNHDQTDKDTPAAEQHATAKVSTAKRGQTSKLSPAIVDEESENDCSDSEAGENAPPLEPQQGILDETAGNKTNKQGVTGPSPSLEASHPLPETPHKQSAQAAKGPDKHSPISSGKVSFRVGLSKRARIEPLLRIVRK